MTPLCRLEEREGQQWCLDCRQYHMGHTLELSQEESEKGSAYRALWRRLSISHARRPDNPLLRSLPIAKQCQHNQGANGTKKAGCGKCTTYACALKGTIKLSDCVYCTDYLEKSVPATETSTLTVENTTRNLLYHIYPVSGNGAWQWNVEQLCGRLKAFNGQKVVAIVTDPPEGRKPDPEGPWSPDRGRVIPGCDTAEAVKAEFRRRWDKDDITFLEMENDPHLREVKPLIPMLSEVLSNDPFSVTLYAQAKGTTRAIGHVARRWTEALYEIMLDHFPLAIEQLNTYHATGCFKKLGAGWSREQTHSDWHYSGSWFWFRTRELYQRDWQKVDQFWSGIEPYPSQQFKASEAGCMFHEAAVPEMNLYDRRYWQARVIPAFNKWRAEQANYRTTMWPK